MFRKNNEEVVSQEASTLGQNWGRNTGVAAAVVNAGLMLPLVVGMSLSARRGGAKIEAAGQAAVLGGLVLGAYGLGSVAGNSAARVARMLDNTLRATYQKFRPAVAVERVEVQSSLQQEEVAQAISLSKNHQ